MRGKRYTCVFFCWSRCLCGLTCFSAAISKCCRLVISHKADRWCETSVSYAVWALFVVPAAAAAAAADTWNGHAYSGVSANTGPGSQQRFQSQQSDDTPPWLNPTVSVCFVSECVLPPPARRPTLVHIISFVRARDSHWLSITGRGIRIRRARTCREPRRGATESINSKCWGSQPPDRQRRGPIRGPLLGVAAPTQLRGGHGNECLLRVIGLSGRVSRKVLTCFHYL